MKDSRTHAFVVRRRRCCYRCGYRWTTAEVVLVPVSKKHRRGAPRMAHDVHPAARFAFEEAERQNLTTAEWSRMSRIARPTLLKMRGTNIPRVDTLDAALQPLGFELVAKRKTG